MCNFLRDIRGGRVMRVCDSARIGTVSGSASIDYVSDSASIDYVYGSASIGCRGIDFERVETERSAA